MVPIPAPQLPRASSTYTREFNVVGYVTEEGDTKVLISDGTILGEKPAAFASTTVLEEDVSNGDQVYAHFHLDASGSCTVREILVGEMPDTDPENGDFYLLLADIAVTGGPTTVTPTQKAWGPIQHVVANCNPDIDPAPGGGVTNARIFYRPGVDGDAMFAARTLKSPNARVAVAEDGNYLTITAGYGTKADIYELTESGDGTSTDYYQDGVCYSSFGVPIVGKDSVRYKGPYLIFGLAGSEVVFGDLSFSGYSPALITRDIEVDSFGFVRKIGPERTQGVSLEAGGYLLGTPAGWGGGGP